jgi:hypothetical protein
MSGKQPKQLPAGSLALSLTTRRNMPALRLPDVKEPYSGRQGHALANEMREKYFRLWHKLVLEQLAIQSAAVLNDYALQIIDESINRMLDRYFSVERHAAANELLQEITQVCIQQLVASVKAILENHTRLIGEFF